MKIRTDFVTNSSSSSFSVVVKVILNDEKEIEYRVDPLDNDNEDIGPVVIDYNVVNQIVKSASIENLCDLLSKVAENYVDGEGYQALGNLIENITEEEINEWDNYPNFETWEKYHNEVQKNKKKFCKVLKKECSSLDDIKKIIISGDYTNSGEYCECDAINDRKLMELAKNVVESDEKDEAVNKFIEYIERSNRYVLVDTKDAENAANVLVGSSTDDEQYSNIIEINMKNKKKEEYKKYYLPVR